ncbi:MAG: hypothetical protein HRU12_07785, partial [Phaeodactylibacter sp.]|nr:hypothetical protein [Phaeodactylibacter sp.]
MRRAVLILACCFCCLPVVFTQSDPVPEAQISFANEDRPFEYYVSQAGLWWEEIQKDLKNEDSWYNYYRANRNAQGKANWSTDFVKAGPHLR